MSKMIRVTPFSLDTIESALFSAKGKLDIIPPANNPLTAATTTRLNNITVSLAAAISQRSIAKALYNANTPKKAALREECLLLVHHFIQVFNLCVARKKFKAGERALFQLEIESSAQPEMATDSALIMWAKFLIDGEASRIAAGLVPMSNPHIGEVQAAYQLFADAYGLQSTLKDALDLKQEAAVALVPQAKRVVKKVWDELETFYNEESHESMRNKCREWGVVYVTKGYPKLLKGKVILGENTISDLKIGFAKGRKKIPLQADSGFEISTTLMGKQTVLVQKFDTKNKVMQQWDFKIVLTEEAVQQAEFGL